MEGGVDQRDMGGLVQHYLECSLAPSTQRTYRAAQKRYQQFCSKASLTPFPATEKTLCAFVASIAKEGLKHQTIKVYMSAIRFCQIRSGGGDPFQAQLPVLHYVLRGIKSEMARQAQQTTRERLPITPDILRKLRSVWGRDEKNLEHIMLWPVCCTCFFGFLRSGEVTVPSLKGYDPGAHLSLDDVALDSRSNPTVVQVRIKASKTDPFRKGVFVYLGKTDDLLCPVAAVTAYMASRGRSPGPFFVFRGGKPLSRQLLVEKLREALSLAGLDPKKYAGHSFRIGAASTAAACGLEDSLIKTLGRWESSAYQLYIRIPRERLAAVSRALVGAVSH